MPALLSPLSRSSTCPCRLAAPEPSLRRSLRRPMTAILLASQCRHRAKGTIAANAANLPIPVSREPPGFRRLGAGLGDRHDRLGPAVDSRDPQPPDGTALRVGVGGR